MAQALTPVGRVLAPTHEKVAAPAAPRVIQHGAGARLDLRSVAKVAVVYWACVGALLTGAFAVLLMILSAMGAVDKAESFVADLTGVDEFRILSGEILFAVGLLVIAFVVVATTLTVASAAFYNVLSRFTGGIEYTVTQQVASARNNGHAPGESVS